MINVVLGVTIFATIGSSSFISVKLQMIIFKALTNKVEEGFLTKD